MSNLFDLQIEPKDYESVANQPVLDIDLLAEPAFSVSPFQELDQAALPMTIGEIPHTICLDLEVLECYEVVQHQFEQWGVRFANAIALHPSNPAFPPHSGTKVLMGAPKSGWLEATFVKPVRYVSGFVTSSRATVMAAFNEQNQPLAQTKTPGANLAGGSADLSPNMQLSLQVDNIHRVTFQAFDGQLTLDDFSFGF
jgi:hypothetical protein